MNAVWSNDRVTNGWLRQSGVIATGAEKRKSDVTERRMNRSGFNMVRIVTPNEKS